MIDDVVKKCEHKTIYITGIQKEEEGFIGQYWFHCIKCETTGLSELKGYHTLGEEYRNKFLYYKK